MSNNKPTPPTKLQHVIGHLPPSQLEQLLTSPSRITSILDNIFHDYRNAGTPNAVLVRVKDLQEIRYLAQAIQLLLS